MIAFAVPPAPADAPQPVFQPGRTIEELTATVSASRLSTWLQCRLKFHLRYVAGVVKPPSAALHVGKTVHAVLQQWSLARWRGSPLDAEAIGAVFEAAWTQPEGAVPIAWEAEEEADSKANALAVIETYLRDTPIPVDEKPEGVEVSVEIDLASHGLPVLIGVLDLVRAGGRIVDYKTTGRTPDPKMVLHTTEVQTTGYALLYREATGQRETGIELHHMVKLKTPKLVVTEAGPATAQQVTRLFHLIDAYVDDLERRDPVPSPGMQCSMCELLPECRLWQ